MQSYRNEKKSGFFDAYNTVLMVYPIQLPDGGYKFNNSDLIARYIHAADLLDTDYTAKIVDRLFTESNSDGVIWQSVLMQSDRADAEKILQSWLKDFGAEEAEIRKLAKSANSDEVSQIMAQIKEMVENKIHAKGIPTAIYDGKKHSGLYQAK